jgi:hypothetical protein
MLGFIGANGNTLVILGIAGPINKWLAHLNKEAAF